MSIISKVDSYIKVQLQLLQMRAVQLQAWLTIEVIALAMEAAAHAYVFLMLSLSAYILKGVKEIFNFHCWSSACSAVLQSRA